MEDMKAPAEASRPDAPRQKVRRASRKNAEQANEKAKAAPTPAPAPLKKFAAIDSEGRVLAFYSSDVHFTIPDGTVEIDEATWLRWLADQHALAWDPALHALVKVTLRRSPPPTLAQLRARRDRALRDSDWAMLPDSPIQKDAARLKTWAAYREMLRHLFDVDQAPEAINFPTEPPR